MATIIFGLGLSCVIIFVAIMKAVITGVGWTILHSSEMCEGSMHSFIYAVTIASTVMLAFLLFTLLIVLVGMCIPVVEFAAGGLFMGMMLISGVLNMVWFVWGIVVLASHECLGTSYNAFSIAIVVLSGIGLCSNCCSSAAVGTRNH